MNKIFLLSILLFFNKTYSQEMNGQQLDLLFKKFLIIHGIILDSDEHEISKCGFGIVNKVKLNLEKYPLERQQLINNLLQRPLRQTSMISPSGFFKIHYDTTGTNTPDYDQNLTLEENVLQVALALDSSYKFEVDFLGYPPPPPDNGGGGDNRYDVYISNLGSIYSYTELETPIGNDKYTSFMVINKSYDGFFSTGLDGMRISVAHELHHAIQIGNYILRQSDIYFYEITSTAMEEFVFDDVNDYYAYIPDYFNNPRRSFPLNNGFNLAIWNIYIKENYGFDILKHQWELIPEHSALMSIILSFDSMQLDFGNELINFGIWTYYTNIRTIPGQYFPEASAYPLISTIPFNFIPPSQLFILNSQPAANNFLKVNLPDSNTLVVIFSNNDYQQALANPNTLFSFEYELFNDSTSGKRFINSFYSANFYVDSLDNWNIFEIMNDIVVNVNDVYENNSYTLKQNYPNPFNPETNILYQIKERGLVQIKVYDILGKEVAILLNEEKEKGNYSISFNGINFSSGVYIYSLRVNDYIQNRKMILIK